MVTLGVKKMEKKRGRPKKDRHAPFKMVRIPLALYEAIQMLADKNRRPTAWEIRLALEEALAKSQG